MKKRKVKFDDGVFKWENTVTSTPEELNEVFSNMVEQLKTAHLTWLDDVREEADKLAARAEFKQDVWRVSELQREISNYHLAAHPEHAAFRIGMILQDARIRIESPYLRYGRDNEEARNKSAESREVDPERDMSMYNDYMFYREDNPHITSKLKAYKAVAKSWYGDEGTYKTIERAVKREEKRRDEDEDDHEI